MSRRDVKSGNILLTKGMGVAKVADVGLALMSEYFSSAEAAGTFSYAVPQILLVAPASRVLVLSAHSDDEYVAHMVAAGAAGYVVKQSSGQLLVNAVRETAAGRLYFSPAILRRLNKFERQARESGTARTPPRRALTAREAEVLQLVAEGAPNKRIATELGISIKTVEKHRQQLMDKLDIHDTAGLTRHAIATGAIESSVQPTTA